jgi:iron complex transport system ATP-binding protein
MKRHNSIALQNLSLAYPGKELISNVSISIEPGVLTSLQGRNGTGKSTLMRCIAGLIKPLRGDVLFNHKSIYSLTPLERSQIIGALWTDKVRMPGITLRELVWMGTYNVRKNASTVALNVVTDECIEALNLQSLSKQPLDQLSDGELQKAMIARALAQQPSFLLLDEPTTYLDYVAKEELMVTLRNLCENKGPGILFTSHDLDVIAKYARQRLELRDGNVHAIG